MEKTIKIEISEYRYLIAYREQIDVLERMLREKAKNGISYVDVKDLKTIFDLWDDIPEPVKPDAPCEYEYQE